MIYALIVLALLNALLVLFVFGAIVGGMLEAR